MPIDDIAYHIMAPADLFGLQTVGKHWKPIPEKHTAATRYRFGFHYVFAGRGTFEAEGEKHELTAGDWFFVFPGQHCRYVADPGDPFLYYWASFNGKSIGSYLATFGINGHRHVVHALLNTKIVERFEELLEIVSERDAAYQLKANGCLSYLLSDLCKQTARGSRQTQRQEPTAAVEQARQFMMHMFNEGISAADVAAHVGYSRTYFAELFHKTEGVTISMFLLRIRMQRACQLLVSTNDSIRYIADACGYQSYRSFCRRFKQRTGMSPDEFRTKRRQ